MKNYNKVRFIVSILLLILTTSQALFASSTCDVNADNNINSMDALQIINRLNRSTSFTNEEILKFDVDRNGYVNAMDVLIVINFLNRRNSGIIESCGKDRSQDNPPPKSDPPPNTDDEKTIDENKEIDLIRGNEDTKGSYISIDEYKSIDNTAVATGAEHIKRNSPGRALVFESKSASESDILTYVENNLSDVWGKTRTNTNQRKIHKGKMGTAESGIRVGASTAYGVAFEGMMDFANGSAARAEYTTSYTAEADSYLDIAHGKEIFLKMRTDLLSGNDINSLSDFEITLTDSTGKSHASLYTVPFFTSTSDMITGGFSIRVRLKFLKDKVDLSKIAKIKLRMMTTPAQDTTIDYIRITVNNKIGSPEDYSGMLYAEN